jgi:hypothetical protein
MDQRNVSRGEIDGVDIWCAFDELLPIDKLVEHPKTNNSHPPRQIELLSKIITIAGWSDWFGGSGTTLIACEITGRNARIMELDPVYCDVIVRRWEEFTGKTAKKWTKSV